MERKKGTFYLDEGKLFFDGEEVEPWRKPDRICNRWAVWYGPGGSEEGPGDAEQATEVENDTVREYQDVEGLFDEVPDDGPFLITQVDIDSRYTVIGERPGEDGETERVHLWEFLEEKQAAAEGDKNRENEILCCWLAAIGVAHLGYWGGESESDMILAGGSPYTNELPK